MAQVTLPATFSSKLERSFTAVGTTAGGGGAAVPTTGQIWPRPT